MGNNVNSFRDHERDYDYWSEVPADHQRSYLMDEEQDQLTDKSGGGGSLGSGRLGGGREGQRRPRRMACRFTAVCIISAALYLAWGIWPLLHWILIEETRRLFCGHLQATGAAYAAFSILSALMLVASWVSLACCSRRGPATRRIYAIPIILHGLALFGALIMTIRASIQLWDSESEGEFCLKESPPFYKAAQTYVEVTYGMLVVQLGVCIFLCRIVYYMFRAPSRAAQFVWTEIVPLVNRGGGDEEVDEEEEVEEYQGGGRLGVGVEVEDGKQEEEEHEQEQSGGDRHDRDGRRGFGNRPASAEQVRLDEFGS